MSKKLKIILALVVILIVDISYTATVHDLGKFLRLGILSTYIEDKTCDAIGGKMIEYYYNCSSERRCVRPFKDANKPCINSSECQGRCVADPAHTCLQSNGSEFFEGSCGKCQEYRQGGDGSCGL